MPNCELEDILHSSAEHCNEIAVNLGNTSVRIISNCASFAGVALFSRSALLDSKVRVDHELWCINDAGGRLRQRIQCYRRARSYRALCFERGYYATDHFGTPVVLHRFDNRYYIVGEHLEQVVWTYFVKFFIFIKSLEQRKLFMKVASVAFGRHGVLIVGRGSGGKTTFAQALCHRGAKLVTNSHGVVDGSLLTGVRTTMRVRPGGKFPTICQHASALREGEVLTDPFYGESAYCDTAVRLETLCIVDHRPDRDEGVTRIGSDHALGFLEQFSLGVNVYRLEEEMLEFYDHDLLQYGLAMQMLHSRLRFLVNIVPCYVVRTDIFDEDKLSSVFDAIGWPSRGTL